MSITIDFDMSEFERARDEFRHDMSDGIRHAVAAACDEGAAEARSTHRYQDRTGALTASTEGHVGISTPGGAEGEIVAGAKYASFVDGGTREHVIEGRGGGMLAFDWKGVPTVVRRVHHPGTAADGFMGRAYQKAERVLLREVEIAAERAADKMNRR